MIAKVVRTAKESCEPWRANKYFGPGECVRIGENVFYTVMGGTSGNVQPIDEGKDGSVLWLLLSSMAAIETYSFSN